MLGKSLSVICFIFCVHPLKSSAIPTPCNLDFISINSLNISEHSKTFLRLARLSVKKLRTLTREEILRRYPIDRGTLQEIEDAFEERDLAFSDGKDLEAPYLLPFDVFKRLGLSTRTANNLTKVKIRSLKQLEARTKEELIELFDIGPASLREIENALKSHGRAPLAPSTSSQLSVSYPLLPVYEPDPYSRMDAQTPKK